MEIINEGIADVEAKAENVLKVNEHLDKEFEDFVYEASKNLESASLLEIILKLPEKGSEIIQLLKHFGIM